MKTRESNLELHIPGKVVLNGSYMVLQGETGVCVPVDRYLNLNCKYSDSPSFNVEIKIKDREHIIMNEDVQNEDFISQIVQTTFDFLQVEKKGNFLIEGIFDPGFFISKEVKLGLGSSACLVTGITYTICHFLQISSKKYLEAPELIGDFEYKEYAQILYLVNKKLNPESSGCDVMTCLLGQIFFSKEIIRPYNPISYKYLILGSYGQSTSTKLMIEIVKNLDWSEMKKRNTEINEGCLSYEKYLDSLHSLSDIIVPNRQYDILKSTFKFPIFGCGISGAGGEDAVWCITNNPDEIVKLWNKNFKHVEVCGLVSRGILIA